MLAPTAAACRPAEGGRARAREAGEPVVQLFLRLNRMRGVDYFQKLELKLAPLSLMVGGVARAAAAP